MICKAFDRIKKALDGYARSHLETNPKKAFHNDPLELNWMVRQEW